MFSCLLSSIMFPLDKGILTDENGTKIKKKFKSITYVEDTIPLVCAGDDLASNTNFAILYCHGNADSIANTHFAAMLVQISEFFKCKVYSYDYPGTAKSAYYTKTTQNGDIEKIIIEDAETIFDYVSKQHNKILLMAHSIGTGPAIYLAEKHVDKIEALVLFSAFSSILSIALGLSIVKNTPLNRIDIFKNYERIVKLQKVDFPIIFFHGKEDKIISYINSVQLYNILISETRSTTKTRMFLYDFETHNSIFNLFPEPLIQIQNILLNERN